MNRLIMGRKTFYRITTEIWYEPQVVVTYINVYMYNRKPRKIEVHRFINNRNFMEF